MPKRRDRAFWSCGLLKERPIKSKSGSSDPDTHRNIFQWACEREELSGESAQKVAVDCGGDGAQTTAVLEPPVVLHAAALHYTWQKPHGTTIGDHGDFRSAQTTAPSCHLGLRRHAGGSSQEVPAVTTDTIPLRRGEPALRRGRSWMKRLQPVVVPREQKSAAASPPKPRRTPRHPAPPAASAPHRFVHEVRRFASSWWGYHSQRHRKWD
jgi:hypothetical protein